MTMMRRSNGISAGSWSLIGDVATAAVGACLSRLAEAGVGAYVEGDGSDSPSSLHADSQHVMLVRALLDKDFAGLVVFAPPADSQSAASRAGNAMPDMDDSELDAAFAAIVAGFDSGTADPVGPWSASEDVEGSDKARGITKPPWAPPDTTDGTRPRLIRRAQPLPDPLAEAAEQDAIDNEADLPASLREEGHFVPPEPPPILRGSTIDRAAWVCVIGSPLVFILSSWIDLGLGALIPTTAAVAFVAGCVTLVVRMPDRPSRADDWDDGAVV